MRLMCCKDTAFWHKANHLALDVAYCVLTLLTNDKILLLYSSINALFALNEKDNRILIHDLETGYSLRI